jgi:GT2 family glycosyltransferase
MTDFAGFRAIMRSDDRLHPEAVRIVAREFEACPELQAIYADVLEGDRIVPRPQWDEDLAASCDFFCAPVFLRTSSPCFANPSDTLRGVAASEGASAIGRIALPLVTRVDGSSTPLAPIPIPELARRPLVSVLIPTKYQIDLLARCLDGLANSGYAEIEVVVVDNGSDDPRLQRVISHAAKHISLISLRDTGEFNFSRLMNFASSRASGELLLLLNDDIEAVEPGWLHRMVESALRPEVGAVGPRLVYPDGTIQHAGVVMGIAGTCGHMWKHKSPDEALRNPLIVRPGRRSAVTGACLMVRKAIYESLGGLDEAFPVNYGDIDFCLRLASQGLRNIYRGDAILVHHESKSTGAVSLDAGRLKREALARGEFLRRWRAATLDDPCGSPAFDPSSESGLIRPALRLRSDG